jgi:16S rRNA U1498 N3-methylase RsmE
VGGDSCAFASRISDEACAQTERAVVPELSGPEPFAAILFARMPLALSRMMT